MHKEDQVKSEVLKHSVAQNTASNSVTMQYQKVTVNSLLSSTQLNRKKCTWTEPIPTPNPCQPPQPIILDIDQISEVSHRSSVKARNKGNL